MSEKEFEKLFNSSEINNQIITEEEIDNFLFGNYLTSDEKINDEIYNVTIDSSLIKKGFND